VYPYLPIRLYLYRSAWRQKAIDDDGSVADINSIEAAKNKALEPSDMPKGKTDLTDQEETKTVLIEQAVRNRKVIIGAKLSTEEES
jgi:hypothetical protein